MPVHLRPPCPHQGHLHTQDTCCLRCALPLLTGAHARATGQFLPTTTLLGSQGPMCRRSSDGTKTHTASQEGKCHEGSFHVTDLFFKSMFKLINIFFMKRKNCVDYISHFVLFHLYFGVGDTEVEHTAHWVVCGGDVCIKLWILTRVLIWTLGFGKVTTLPGLNRDLDSKDTAPASNFAHISL